MGWEQGSCDLAWAGLRTERLPVSRTGTACWERGSPAGGTEAASDETGKPASCESWKLMEEHLSKGRRGEPQFLLRRWKFAEAASELSEGSWKPDWRLL